MENREIFEDDNASIIGKKRKRNFIHERYPKRRIALMFLYFGWNYEGLICQPNTPNTVSFFLKHRLPFL